MAAALRAAIESGELQPGDKLPSERSLAATLRGARNTASEAVRQLAESGLVTADHGRGVFVRVEPRLMRFGQSGYSRRLREETGLSPFHAEVAPRDAPRTPTCETSRGRCLRRGSPSGST